jgi:Arc/MetJ-type ribon-helix-helix transcriptional regulator
VERGEYADEADLVAQSVQALKEDAEERERWEQENVVAAHDAFLADPTTAISSEELMRELAQARLERRKAS